MFTNDGLTCLCTIFKTFNHLLLQPLLGIVLPSIPLSTYAESTPRLTSCDSTYSYSQGSRAVPIRFPRNNPIQRAVCNQVKALRGFGHYEHDIVAPLSRIHLKRCVSLLINRQIGTEILLGPLSHREARHIFCDKYW